jgi:hypothetical protein
MLQRPSSLVFLLLSASLLFAGIDKKPDPTPAEIPDIIKKFTQKETDFAKARESYTYRQNVKMTETAPVGGTFEIIEEVSFDDRNKRTSHVVYSPVQSLEYIVMTKEDEEDMRNIFPFVFTNDTVDQYTVTYKRREQLDEISCYVFSVTPKELTKDRKRYFDGDIWVDDQDLQIVKTFGKGAGFQKKSEDQQFAKFETYREQIDGKYWFPTYTYADDTLNFRDGQSQRIKIVVKYDHYKKWQFKSESTITYGKEDTTKPSAPVPPPPPTPNPKN